MEDDRKRNDSSSSSRRQEAPAPLPNSKRSKIGKECSRGNRSIRGVSRQRQGEAAKSSQDENSKAGVYGENVQQHGFNTLDALTMSVICSFLDVKSLYRIAFCSKFLIGIVTHEHVVRSAMISGGNAKRTMTELSYLIKRQSIVIPSPLRLLRLTNGRYCEHGALQCENGEKKKVSHVRPGQGIFLCWECLTKSTEKLGSNNTMLENPRVLRSEYGRHSYVMSSPFIDLSGERAGSLLSYSEYCDLIGEQQGKSKSIKQHLEELDKNGTNPWGHMHATIVECFETAQKDKEGRDKESSADDFKRKSAALAKRIEKVKVWVAMVESFLAVPTSTSTTGSQDGNPWLEHLLLCNYKNPTLPGDALFIKTTEPCGAFACPLVDIKLRHVAISPSKGNKKKMRGIAIQLRGEMELIWSKKFHDFTFLSDDAEKEPFEYALRVHLQKICTVKDLLNRRNINETTIDLIRQDRLLEAVRTLFGADIPNAFAEAMVSSTENIPTRTHFDSTPTRALTRTNEMDMAKTLWWGLFELNNESISRDLKSAYTSQYSRSASAFARLLPLAKEYVDFVWNNVYKRVERQEDDETEIARVKGICCSSVWHSRIALDYLEKRDFDSARRLAWNSRYSTVPEN